MQARYFAPKNMEEQSIVLLCYGTDYRFHGREVRSFAVLWKRKELLYGRKCMFHGIDYMFYGRECIIY